MNLDLDHSSVLGLQLVDLESVDRDVDLHAGPVVAVGSAAVIGSERAQPWVQRATFTLSSEPVTDPRVVTVPSVEAATEELARRVRRWPQAASICDDVLRAAQPDAPVWTGVAAESLAYSTLQSGREFATWLASRGPAVPAPTPDPVVAERDGNVLHIWFNRPERHNAFSTDMRQALLDLLAVAVHDPSIEQVVIAGRGPSFCSGGDLAEFGTFEDPASAHVARTRHSPALALSVLSSRLGEWLVARVHGRVIGSGLEMAAFCGRVEAHPDSQMALPELSLGLIPGAGGTVSITRRIGRWRTAYLVLSGQPVSAQTCLEWGLVDAITMSG
ncbi:MAG: enoyl-CoA hydratase/isomerase family protein [Mycobacterium sp.]